jgi:quinol monooxygenase YgiN
MGHVGHLSMKAKPGSYARVSAHYHRFADDVMAHHSNLDDVLIVGDPAKNIVEGFGTWEDAAQAATLEDTRDSAAFLADVEPDLAEPIQRSDLQVLYRLKPRP